MYKIIGNDGKTYGPVTADKLREWITQGRVESRTSVLPEGATEWTFIGLLPEFGKDFSGPPPVIMARSMLLAYATTPSSSIRRASWANARRTRDRTCTMAGG